MDIDKQTISMTSKQALVDVLGFDDRRFVIVGIPLLSFAVPLLFFDADLSNGLIAYLPKWGISILYTLGYWLASRNIIIAMRRRYPAYSDIHIRLFYTIILIVAAFFVVSTVVGAFDYWCLQVKQSPNVTEFDYKIASFTILSLVSTIYESIFLYDRWKRSIIEAEKLKSDHIQSQLEGLKSQVNPHFLFNSLNTLTYIIPEDPDTAVKFVQKLSKVYRYILEIRDTKLISLSEELSFLNAYVFLLKERFGESLNVQINVPEAVHHLQIVPLSLQILFENAIKHNIISSRQPLQVEVFLSSTKTSDCPKLVVRNNLQKKRQAMPSTRVGLENIRSRYAFFSDQKMTIAEDENYFTVTLPLIHAQLPVEGQASSLAS